MIENVQQLLGLIKPVTIPYLFWKNTLQLAELLTVKLWVFASASALHASSFDFTCRQVSFPTNFYDRGRTKF